MTSSSAPSKTTESHLPEANIWREVITIINTLITYLTDYPFVRYALIVGVLIALCSSLLGVILVLKRFSYIGDGLSHVAFGAMAIAAVVGLTDNMLLTLPITIVCAILLLWTGQNAKIKGDAAIAMISVGALAVGYLLMNLFPTSSNISGDVCSTLFGSAKILTLTKSEVILSIVLSVIVVILFIAFYNRFFAVTFDENFARAVGTKANLLNLLIATVIAVIIVLAMNLVGSLLVSALVIFPALSAMRIFKSFKSVTICSAVISVFCALTGIILSILWGTPTGSTIVITDIAAFILCIIAGKIRN
jgi:zinc transport system permease protein